MDRHRHSRLSLAASACRIALAAAPLLLVAGCFSGHVTYQEGGSPAAVQGDKQAGLAASAASGTCPNLEGHYSNRGELAPSTPRELCEGPSHKYRYVGDWRCETGLASNIAGLNASSLDTVVLRQPDADTLEVLSGVSTAVLTQLHRSKGDFACKDKGLVRRLMAPAMSQGDETDAPSAVDAFNLFQATMGVFMASAGVQTLTRTFTRTADGSLLMTVQRSRAGLIVGFPYSENYSTYVIWPQATVATPVLQPTVTWQPSTPVATAALLPFKSFGGLTWYVSVDDHEYGLDPLDVTPGEHWVEFFALSAGSPSYGAMLVLEEGHTYQLAVGPPDCSPTGGADRQDADGQLQWREVKVNDVTEGQLATIHTVNMMCRLGAQRCEVDAVCGRSERCMLYPGSGWGYCAKSPPN